MPSSPLEPNGVSYNAAIKCTLWEGTFALLHRMGRQLLTPNVVSQAAAIGSCAKEKQCWKALGLPHQMIRQSLKKDVVSLGTAIGACGKDAW